MNGPPLRLEQLSPERWRQIEALVDDVLGLEPRESAAALERACARDPELRAQVEAVLAADAQTQAPLDTPLAERMPELLAEASSFAEPGGPVAEGTRLGPWRIGLEIGRGGMGAVYRAERADGLYEQAVAIKLLKRGLDTDEILTRFRRERRILARLEHPHIARLVDGGATATGQPWLAMEHVEGEPITDWVRRKQPSLAGILALFDQVCDAVAHAHRNLIVHRDLKPTNILVTDAGDAKLLDFGVARVLDPDLADTPRTSTEARVMTPPYSAPEQIRGETPTTATDVYGLGVVLYELLTGAWPYGQRPSGSPEVQRLVLDAEPIVPSAAVSKPSPDGRPQQPPAWRHTMRGDLDAILLKALRKEPAERYASVDALRADLAAYREGRPVAAARDTVRYRVAKFMRRHRAGVIAGAAVLGTLVAGLSATAWQARVARGERDRARVEARRAEAMRDFLLTLFEQADPNVSRGDTLTARELLDRGAQRLDRTLSDQPGLHADMLHALAEMYGKLGLYDRAQAMAVRAVEVRRRTFGARSKEYASSLSDLGAALAAEARFHEADSVLRKAHAIQVAAGSPGADVAGTLRHLGFVENSVGHSAAAERLFERALALDERALGPDAAAVADDLSELATVYLDARGSSERALPLFRRAVAIRMKTLGSSDLATVTAMQNLAEAFNSVGKRDSATRLDFEVVSMRRRIQGPEHPDLAFAMSNLAVPLLFAGRDAEAESLFVQALRIERKRLGPEHPETVRTENNYVFLLSSRGRNAEAEPVIRHVNQAWTKTLGPFHPNTIRARGSLGRVLMNLGRNAEAEALLLETERALRGAPNPAAVLPIEMSLGSLYRRLHRPDEAERRYRRAVEITRADSADVTGRRDASLELAALLRESGRLREARAIGEGALANADRDFGSEDGRRGRPRLDLAWTLALLHEHARAESLCHAVIADLGRTGAKPWRANVVMALSLAGRSLRAESSRLLDENLDSLVTVPGATDSLVRDARALRARLRGSRRAT